MEGGLGAVPRRLDELVHRLAPDASRADVNLAFDLVGSLLGARARPLSLPSVLSAASGAVAQEEPRFMRLRRRLEPLALSQPQL